jgi:hypothetical protein
MRLAGALLALVGLVAAVVAAFSGCGALFSWNGRHPIESRPLGEGPVTETLLPDPGRRYTVSVVVVFDREGLERRDDGLPVVRAKLPLVVRVKDPAGTSLAEATGWLDPDEPPNVLSGLAARERARGPTPELSVERLVGPFTVASSAPLTIDVTLGPDRAGGSRIAARRVVVYDDALPPSIRNAFIVVACGSAAFLAGIVVLVGGWLRRRSRSAAARRPSARRAA